MGKINRFLSDKEIRFAYLTQMGFFNKMSDKDFLQKKYQMIFGKELNLENPCTFNEKLNWLKVYDQEDRYTKLADKILVKKFVEEKIGGEYVIPLYKEYQKPEDISLEELPDQFVLKCNHDSGGAFICRDKSKFDLASVQKRLKKNLKRNWYYSSREWAYKNIKPMILAEKYIEDPTSDDLIDYKFFCFNGEPKYVYTTVKNSNIYENYYDLDFNKVNINHGYPRRDPEFQKPQNFDKMVELVKVLCKDIPFVRLDMHNVDGKIYFGEFTFYDWAGLKPFPDPQDDEKLGKLLDLSNIKG